VLEDSRCPRGVRCVWEGNARVRLIVDLAGAALALELDTHPERTGAAHLGGYELRLLDLAPYPDLARAAERREYRALLLLVPRDATRTSDQEI
jgi:hypothetical protein